MKTTKKALLTVLCALLLVVVSVLGTIAYFTDSEAVTNTFTVGKVEITLDEKDVDDSTANKDRDTSNAYHLLPGQTYEKDPTVHVTAGSEECYVRMFLTITKSGEWDAICNAHKKPNSDENLFGIMDILTGYDSATWIYKGNVENADNTRTYEFWYKEKVTNIPKESDKDLPALFAQIKMPGEITGAELATLMGTDNTTTADDFNITVIAHAIQAAGFADADAAWAAWTN